MWHCVVHINARQIYCTVSKVDVQTDVLKEVHYTAALHLMFDVNPLVFLVL